MVEINQPDLRDAYCQKLAALRPVFDLLFDIFNDFLMECFRV